MSDMFSQNTPGPGGALSAMPPQPAGGLFAPNIGGGGGGGGGGTGGGLFSDTSDPDLLSPPLPAAANWTSDSLFPPPTATSTMPPSPPLLTPPQQMMFSPPLQAPQQNSLPPLSLKPAQGPPSLFNGQALTSVGSATATSSALLPTMQKRVPTTTTTGSSTAATPAAATSLSDARGLVGNQKGAPAQPGKDKASRTSGGTPPGGSATQKQQERTPLSTTQKKKALPAWMTWKVLVGVGCALLLVGFGAYYYYSRKHKTSNSSGASNGSSNTGSGSGSGDSSSSSSSSPPSSPTSSGSGLAPAIPAVAPTVPFYPYVGVSPEPSIGLQSGNVWLRSDTVSVGNPGLSSATAAQLKWALQPDRTLMVGQQCLVAVPPSTATGTAWTLALRTVPQKTYTTQGSTILYTPDAVTSTDACPVRLVTLLMQVQYLHVGLLVARVPPPPTSASPGLSVSSSPPPPPPSATGNASFIIIQLDPLAPVRSVVSTSAQQCAFGNPTNVPTINLLPSATDPASVANGSVARLGSMLWQCVPLTATASAASSSLVDPELSVAVTRGFPALNTPTTSGTPLSAWPSGTLYAINQTGSAALTTAASEVLYPVLAAPAPAVGTAPAVLGLVRKAASSSSSSGGSSSGGSSNSVSGSVTTASSIQFFSPETVGSLNSALFIDGLQYLLFVAGNLMLLDGNGVILWQSGSFVVSSNVSTTLTFAPLSGNYRLQILLTSSSGSSSRVLWQVLGGSVNSWPAPAPDPSTTTSSGLACLGWNMYPQVLRRAPMSQVYMQTCGAFLQSTATCQRGTSATNVQPSNVTTVTLNWDNTLTAMILPSSSGTGLGSSSQPQVLGCIVSLTPDGTRLPVGGASPPPTVQFRPQMDVMNPSTLIVNPLALAPTVATSAGSSSGQQVWVPFRFVAVRRVETIFTVGLFVAMVMLPAGPVYFMLEADPNPFIAVGGSGANGNYCVATNDQTALTLNAVAWNSAGGGPPVVYAQYNTRTQQVTPTITPVNRLFQLGTFASPVSLPWPTPYAQQKVPYSQDGYVSISPPLSPAGSTYVTLWGPLNVYTVNGVPRWMGCSDRMLVLGSTFSFPCLVVFSGGNLFLINPNGMILWQSGSFDVYDPSSTTQPNAQMTTNSIGDLHIMSGQTISGQQSWSQMLWSSNNDNVQAFNSLINQKGPVNFCNLTA